MADDSKKQPRKAAKKKRIPIVSTVLSDETIVETIFRSDENVTLFCVGNRDEWSYKYHITVGKQRFVPYSPQNNLLQHEVLLLPSEPVQYDSEKELIAEIQTYIHKYVDVSEQYELIASYYVLLSWVYDSFNELPYLRLIGDPGSGKTRFLLTVGALCYKPIFASGASTISPLFRMMNSIRGTLIIDEGDFRLSDEKAEVIKILNNGNARGFPVLRSEITPAGEYNPRAFTVYGPKLVATRRQFADNALETRCLTERMGQRQLRKDIPVNLPPEQKEDGLRLRNKLLSFRLCTRGTHEISDELENRDIEPRLKQMFSPLLSVIPEQWARNEVLQMLYTFNRDLATQRASAIEAQLLEVVCDLRKNRSKRLSVKEITEAFAVRFANEYERTITAKWIGGILRTRLNLKTAKSNGVYIIPALEERKLAWLMQRYGITDTYLGRESEAKE